MPQMPGQDVRTIRERLGLPVSKFAAVLGVHPSTVHRWESAGPAPVPIEGIPWNVLWALRQRVSEGNVDPSVLRVHGQEVSNALVVGGALVALGVLIALASGQK